MKNAVAVLVGAGMLCSLCADQRKFAIALQRLEHHRTLPNLLHAATFGLFVAEDIAALG